MWADQEKKKHPTAYVLCDNDINRIQDLIEGKEREKQKIEGIRREKLRRKETSDAMARYWEDTIQGVKERYIQKLKDTDKVKQEEAKRLAALEGERNAKEKELQLCELNKKRYLNCDKVKTLKRAMILSEILYERDRQVKFKRDLDDDRFKTRIAEERELLNKANEDKAEMKRLKEWAKYYAKEVGYQQQKQIAQHKLEDEKAKQAALKEKEEIDRKYQEYLEEEAEKKRKQMALKKYMHDVNEACMQEKMKVAEERDALDAMAERDRRRTAQAKRDLEREKKLKLAADKAEMEAMRHKLYAAADAQRIKDAEELERRTRMNENAGKEEQQMEDDRRKQLALQRRLDSSAYVKEQMELKEDHRRREREADLAYTRELKKRTEDWMKEEKEIKDRKFQNAKKVEAFQARQVALRKQKECEEKEQERLSKINTDQEEKDFIEYAHCVLKNMEERGRNVYPIKRLVLSGIPDDPSVGPIYPESVISGLKVKEIQKSGNTRERCGFVW